MVVYLTVLGYLMAFHKVHVWAPCCLLFTLVNSLKSSNTICLRHMPTLTGRAHLPARHQQTIRRQSFHRPGNYLAIPTQWRHHLKMCNNYEINSLVPNSAQLHLNGHNIRLDKAISKNIYKKSAQRLRLYQLLS